MVTCGNADQPLRSVDVLPGRASTIQAIHGMMQAWRRIIETTLAGFTAQPKGVFLPPRAVVHKKTRRQRWSRLLELF